MTRFVPGRSGNPKGRPRGARNLAAQYLAEANAPASSDPMALTKLQAAMQAQLTKAIQGDVRAIKDVLERVERLEVEKSAERQPVYSDADREAVGEIHRRLAPEPVAADNPPDAAQP